MSGYFEKAPLSYVSIRLNTTILPKPIDSQKAQLQQAMLGCDLVFYETSIGKRVKLNNDVNNQFNVDDVVRYGFLDAEKLNSLIFDETGIEWRTTQYTEYDQFIERFSNIFTNFIEAASIYSKARVSEIVLSYVDMIIPDEGCGLNQYFSDIIKLPVADELKTGVFTVGVTSISNVIHDNLKIDISLEQLPQKFKKYLPEAVIEPEIKFGMNITNPAVLSDDNGTEYALLMTRASILIDKKLGELNCVDDAKPLHEITKDTFYKVINEEFCKEKWNYVEGGQ